MNSGNEEGGEDEELKRHREEVEKRIQECTDEDLESIEKPDLTKFKSIKDVIGRLISYNLVQAWGDEKVNNMCEAERMVNDNNEELMNRAGELLKEYRDYIRDSQMSGVDQMASELIDSLAEKEETEESIPSCELTDSRQGGNKPNKVFHCAS